MHKAQAFKKHAGRLDYPLKLVRLAHADRKREQELSLYDSFDVTSGEACVLATPSEPSIQNTSVLTPAVTE